MTTDNLHNLHVNHGCSICWLWKPGLRFVFTFRVRVRVMVRVSFRVRASDREWIIKRAILRSCKRQQTL